MSDTTPRDQLAQIINEHMEADVPETVADKHEPVDADYAMADAIIRAGWRPPASTVGTEDELDAPTRVSRYERTVEFQGQTLLDLDQYGHLIRVELVGPVEPGEDE